MRDFAGYGHHVDTGPWVLWCLTTGNWQTVDYLDYLGQWIIWLAGSGHRGLDAQLYLSIGNFEVESWALCHFSWVDPIVSTGWQRELSCWGVCFYNIQKNANLPKKHCIVIRLSIWFTSTCSEVIHLREVYKVSPAMTTSSFRFDSISFR